MPWSGALELACEHPGTARRGGGPRLSRKRKKRSKLNSRCDDSCTTQIKETNDEATQIVSGTRYFPRENEIEIWKGTFEYYPKISNMDLKEGEWICEDGYREKGTFELLKTGDDDDDDEGYEVRLAKGEKWTPSEDPKGFKKEIGIFKWSRELKRMFLKDGTVSYPSGETWTGVFRYGTQN